MAEKTENKPSPAVRFSNMVQSRFSEFMGVELGKKEMLLIQNYQLGVDKALKAAELRRRDQSLPAVDWNNINIEELSQNLVSYAKAGLDPTVKNHLNFIPYFNSKTKKYDIGFLVGYKGLEVRAKNQGLDVPADVQIRLVHSNEKLVPLYTSHGDSYEFVSSEDPFDKGELKGGIIYKDYAGKGKNVLWTIPLKDILKRKPKNAAPEFWGGSKTVWENGKPTQKKEVVEGWFDEMCRKTLERMAWDSITLDPAKTVPITTKEFNEFDFEDADYTVLTPKAIETPVETVEEKKERVRGSKKQDEMP